tara:strand:+ start:1732 stop:1950 length:219 start_codon:yes stop_codon:yes gene_type:complete
MFKKNNFESISATQELLHNKYGKSKVMKRTTITKISPNTKKLHIKTLDKTALKMNAVIKAQVNLLNIISRNS